MTTSLTYINVPISPDSSGSRGSLIGGVSEIRIAVFTRISSAARASLMIVGIRAELEISR